jgi:predicted RNase H-like nuclease
MNVRNSESFRVAGVDGCKAGWVVALVRAAKATGRGLQQPLTVEIIHVSPHFTDVLLKTSDCALVLHYSSSEG